MRFEKVWLPARAIAENLGCSIQYYKEVNAVCIDSEDVGHLTMPVVKAGIKQDDGEGPILLNNTVYISIKQLNEIFSLDVKWDAQAKTVNIKTQELGYFMELGDGLRYETKTGDFYNGTMLITNLSIQHLDSLEAEKVKTPNGNFLYKLHNVYGEPHINEELYVVYVVNGGIHIASSAISRITGDNSLIQDNKVVLIDKNVISVYDDMTGNILKRHTISSKPLKDYLAEFEASEAMYEESRKGYIIEGFGDDFILCRNETLKTLTLINLKNDKEIELYKAVLSQDEINAIEAGIREDGDYLQVIKAEKGILYLKSTFTGKNYTYQYQK